VEPFSIFARENHALAGPHIHDAARELIQTPRFVALSAAPKRKVIERRRSVANLDIEMA
jgi:hypothetical protein